MASPKILVNLVSLSGGALTREQHVVRGLVDAVTKIELHVLCPSGERSAIGSGRNMVVHEADHPDGTAGRLLWENTALQRHVRRTSADLLYFPLHVTNLIDRCPKVSAVRNVAPYYSEAHAGATWRQRHRLRLLRLATRRTIAQSERVVFMSEATKRRVTSEVPDAEDKAVVIPHGVPPGFGPGVSVGSTPERYGLPDSFLLSVSNVARYKNLIELVDGYALALESADLPPLVIAGEVHDERYAHDLQTHIDAFDLADRVLMPGYVAHDDLPSLHAASDMFVFSSACENAPISLIEALACGSTVVCSNVASMPEICGNAAAYFDPYDPDDIGETLVDLWCQPERRAMLAQRAIDRAEIFDWDHTARETGRLFSELVR